ncbi:hypothetical protein [Streptomyces sp. NPDC006739]|uniref:hypothetical protein n=1 Tax=Streptomyces sp. NPDC006739 TaxID=3364763 RepID=UPI0036BA11CD
MLCAVAALTGTSATAAGAQGAHASAQGSYAFAPGARFVRGAAGTTDAQRLEPGRIYRSSIPRNGKLSYRLDLTATTTAYVPVTAVPPSTATVAATDGIRVSMRDAHGTTCSNAAASFGAGHSPQPVTALGWRDVGKALCQGPGTYYVQVERVDATGSGAAGQGSWDLELAPVSEPRAAKAGATGAPEVWDSSSPRPLTGEPHRRAGGAGFATAATVGQGVWRSDIEPGQTLFYKVPVDWGQQVHATAELGGFSGARSYVTGALDMALYNPVRGHVDDMSVSYTGTQKSAELRPLPPVEYANRYAVLDEVSAVRFAGDYYLVVHLNGQMADMFGPGPFGVTLRVRVGGAPHAGPGYAGQSQPHDLFEVTAQDRQAAAAGTDGINRSNGSDGGGTGSNGGGATVMRVVAVGGIGAGTALLSVLGVWTVAARRGQTRASAQKPTA